MYAVFIQINGSLWVEEKRGFADFHQAAEYRDDLVYRGISRNDLEIRRVG